MTTGILNDLRTINGKFGQFTVLTIDGREYNLGKFVKPEALSALSVGSTVEYEASPNGAGTKFYVNKIRVVGGAPTNPTPVSTTTAPVVGATVTTTRNAQRDADPNRQASVMFSYAKDLVAAGIVETPVKSPSAVADLVSTVASALMERFKVLTAPTEAPTSGGTFPR